MLAAIVESSLDAIIGKDLNGTITSWNSGAEHLFGYATEEIIGKPITTLIPPDKYGEEAHILGCLRRGERVAPLETVRLRKDGSAVDVFLSVSPIRNKEGRVVGASKIARDITELQRARKQQALLLREMKHRISNLLAVMDALGRNAIPKHESFTQVFFGAFMGRVRALLSAGEIVISSSAHIADLGEVAKAALNPFMGSHEPVQIHIGGPSLYLTESAAGGLALAFHELATNALKYGALGSPDGNVDLSWTIEKSMVRIVWKECVPGSLCEPTTRGFGSRLIKAAIAGEQHGRTVLQYEPNGLKCVFEFEVSN
jgi:PAS domain S-box-containing protein